MLVTDSTDTPRLFGGRVVIQNLRFIGQIIQSTLQRLLKGLLQKHPEGIRQGKPRVDQQSKSPRKKEGNAQT
jgi:hypothetical protein